MTSNRNKASRIGTAKIAANCSDAWVQSRFKCVKEGSWSLEYPSDMVVLLKFSLQSALSEFSFPDLKQSSVILVPERLSSSSLMKPGEQFGKI